MTDERRKDFLIGVMMGQISELLNNIKTVPLTNAQIYASLIDIQKGAALVCHKLYYKEETNE